MFGCLYPRLRVTAIVYGCEVDYAVVEPGDLPPEITLQPRQPGESQCLDLMGSFLGSKIPGIQRQNGLGKRKNGLKPVVCRVSLFEPYFQGLGLVLCLGFSTFEIL